MDDTLRRINPSSSASRPATALLWGLESRGNEPSNFQILLAAVCAAQRTSIPEWARRHGLPVGQVISCMTDDAECRGRASGWLLLRIEEALIEDAEAAGLLADEIEPTLLEADINVQ